MISIIGNRRLAFCRLEFPGYCHVIPGALFFLSLLSTSGEVRCKVVQTWFGRVTSLRRGLLWFGLGEICQMYSFL